MPRHRSAVLSLLVVSAAIGCRHAPPPAPLPSNWASLVAAPRPFSGLYRLSCCGRRDLVLGVRGDEATLALSVAVPPGGAALAAWVGPDGGWVNRMKEGCRDPLPEGVLPLSPKASLPVDPRLATLLLSGLLPAGARELPEAPGWVGAEDGGLVWRARVEGPQPHMTRVILTRAGERSPVLVVEITDSNGRVPARIAILAGREEADLVIQAWRQSDPPSPPAWLALPVCGGPG